MEKELFVIMVLNAWNKALSQVDKLFAELSDEQLQIEIVPNGNRGIYLLGHLAAVNSQMLPLLDFGDPVTPHLYVPFIQTADKDIVDWPSTSELRSAWTKANAELAKHMNAATPDQWFQRHSAVSEQDFMKESHRNKLNVIINRTNHLLYHFGQLVLLKKRVQ